MNRTSRNNKLDELGEEEEFTIELPKIVSAEALLKRDLPLPDELIKGLVHQGSKASLSGGSKSFKTWAMLDIGLSLATGVAWWGRNTKPCKVLFLNFEVQDAFCRKRIEQLAQFKFVGKRPSLKNLKYWGLRGYTTNADLLLASIEEQLEEEQFSALLFDPLYKLMGSRSENAANEVGMLLNQLEKIAMQCDAALFYDHHYSKGNQASKDHLDRASGSGAFARDPDTFISMTKHEIDDHFTIETSLRNFPPVAPFVVKWNWPLFEATEEDPTLLKQIKPNKKRFKVEQLLKALPASGQKAEEWCNTVILLTGMSRRTFFNLKREAEKADKVVETNGIWKPKVQ